MAKFGSNSGGDDSAYTQLIAKIQDIKGAPHHGQKRLVVREEGKRHHQTIIDIDMSAGRDLEERETYVFNVKEKDEKRYGYSSRRDTGLKSYLCDDKPEECSSSDALTESTFNRFGGAGRLNKGKRIKF